MPSVRQPSFAGGEIAPELWGRDDVAKHAVGLRTCRNFLVAPSGAALNRTGSVTVARTKEPFKKSRLIPFFFAAGQNCVLEVGEHYIRFFRNGAPLSVWSAPAWRDWTAYAVGAFVSYDGKIWFAQFASTGHEPGADNAWLEQSAYEIATDYDEDDLARIQYAQQGDVLILTHPAYPPRELRRVAEGLTPEWTLTDLDFDVPEAFFYDGAPQLRALDIGPGITSEFHAPDADHPPASWRWAVTTLCEALDGSRRWETAPQDVTSLRLPGYEIWTEAKRYVPLFAPDWNRVTAYTANKAVRTNGRWYYALLSSTDKYPPDNPLYWRESSPRVCIDGITGAYWYCTGSVDSLDPGRNPTTDPAAWNGPNLDWQDSDESLLLAGHHEDIALPDVVVLAPDLPMTLAWPAPDLFYSGERTFRVLGWNVYRGLKGLPKGWVGFVEPSQKKPDTWASGTIYDGGVYVMHGGHCYVSLAGSNAHEPGASGSESYWRWSEYPRPFFTDYAGEPDYTKQPPSGTNPFKRPDPSDTGADPDLIVEYPACCAHFDQRRVFGNTYDEIAEAGRPADIVGSRLGDYSNFDHHEWVVLPDDSFTFTLAATRYEEIRALVPMRRLLVLTSASEWMVGGSGGSALSPLSVEARVQSAHGSDWLAPLVVGHTCVFLQEAGQRVRDLVFAQGSDGYESRDLSLWSRHMFAQSRLVDWTFARHPLGTIWAVRNDGRLLSCAYEPEQEVLAWSRHDTDGSYESVCAIPEEIIQARWWRNGEPEEFTPPTATEGGGEIEGGYYTSSGAAGASAVPRTLIEDGLYVIVERASTAGGFDNAPQRWVERFASRRFADVREGVFVDGASGADGRNNDLDRVIAFRLGAGGLAYTGKFHVNAINPGQFAGLEAGGACRLVLAPDSTSPVYLEVAQKIGDDDIIVRVQGGGALPDVYRDAFSVDFGIEVASVTATQLAGQAVAGIVDGIPFEAEADDDGVVELPSPGLIVRVGRAYQSDLELLDLFGTARHLVKTVHKVDFEIIGSRGLSAGETFSRLTAWEPPAPLATANQGTFGLVSLRISNSWNAHGRACLRQSAALPLTVLSVTREVEVGG